MADLSRKVADVTGAASGIGRMCALLYAREGAEVVVSDLNEKGGQETVRLIEGSKGHGFFVKTNVADPVDCETLIKKN